MKEQFIHKEVPMPYCKGCGHTLILNKLAQGLAELEMTPTKVVFVTDIGCVGLADKLLKAHTVHTLHGRSTAVATGISLAEDIMDNHRLKTVVLIGDGGSTIGLLHLVEAARLNADMTVIVHNNFLYGMTGGQHSGFTPDGFVTRTTREGCPYPPLNICDILKTAGADFVARGLAHERQAGELIKQGISKPGFAVIELLELCTGFATRYNPMNAKVLNAISEEQGMPLGVLHSNNRPTPTFSKSGEVRFFKTIEEGFSHNLTKPLKLVLGSSAGMGGQFIAAKLAQAAIASGLEVTQKSDNPVTIGTGYSTSELIFSDQEILYTGIDSPDYILITSADGYARLKNRISSLDRGTIIAEASLDLDTDLPVIRHSFQRFRKIKGGAVVSAMSFLLGMEPFISMDAFKQALGAAPNGADLIAVAEECYQLSGKETAGTTQGLIQ